MSIIINNLDKKYNNFYALNKINLEINNGIFGLLGKNGAGKTTLMRILVTLLEPTNGSIEMFNIPIIKKNYYEIKSMIGYLPQELGFYPNMTVYDFLSYMAILQEIPENIYKYRIEDLLIKVNLIEEKNKKTKNLSGGMKRRLGLAQAMLNSPKVLIVDEPTTGLDPEERIRLRNMLSDFAQGRIVILSTHIVEDIVAISKNIAILHKGKMEYNGSITQLIESVKNKIYLAKFNKEKDIIDFSNKYTIITKTYVEDEIDIKFISDKKPEVECNIVEATMEDAFIYTTKIKGD